ncbi:leishmanolysin-like peptidase [Branchiostoma floridae x Branchiostoma japonicum]
MATAGNNISVTSAFSLLVSLFLCLLVYAQAHKCTHRVPKPNEVVHGVHIEPAHIVKKRSLDQPLRIHLVYDSSIEQLSTEKKDLVKNVLFPQAKEFLQNTLYVRGTGVPILLDRQCQTGHAVILENDPHLCCETACNATTRCGEVQVPEEHLRQCRIWTQQTGCNLVGNPSGPGVASADFILYVSAKQTDRCGVDDTVAYAAYCQLEAALDRPVAGYANLCPNVISTKPHEFASLLSTVKHEMIHALGFSSGLFAFYRDENGDPLTDRNANGKPAFNDQLGVYQWSDRVIQEVTYPEWHIRGGRIIPHTVNVIITPKVVEEIRNHFNCSDLQGAEIENQGGAGTEWNHWEKRLLESEAMTGSHTQNRAFSRLTLALMEDTGWYRANYDMAEPLLWGKNLGCDFAKKSCKYWIDSQTQKGELVAPYCNTVQQNPLQLRCSIDRVSVALCNLQNYNRVIPEDYQYFDSIPGQDSAALQNFGGGVALADYCPFNQEFNWQSDGVFSRASNCDTAENAPSDRDNYALEYYGQDSKCVEQGRAWMKEDCRQRAPAVDWGSGCYKYRCTNQGLIVDVAGKEYRCYRKGQELPIATVKGSWLYTGSLICPSCEEMCWDNLQITCPAETDPPNVSTASTRPQVPCGTVQSVSQSSGRTATLGMLFLNLIPLLIGILLCNTP